MRCGLTSPPACDQSGDNSHSCVQEATPFCSHPSPAHSSALRLYHTTRTWTSSTRHSCHLTLAAITPVLSSGVMSSCYTERGCTAWVSGCYGAVGPALCAVLCGMSMVRVRVCAWPSRVATRSTSASNKVCILGTLKVMFTALTVGIISWCSCWYR